LVNIAYVISSTQGIMFYNFYWRWIHQFQRCGLQLQFLNMLNDKLYKANGQMSRRRCIGVWKQSLNCREDPESRLRSAHGWNPALTRLTDQLGQLTESRPDFSHIRSFLQTSRRIASRIRLCARNYCCTHITLQQRKHMNSRKIYMDSETSPILKDETCWQLSLDILELRWLHFDFIICYKIVF